MIDQRSKLRSPKSVCFDLGHTIFNLARYEVETGHRRMLELASNPRGATLEDILSIQEASIQERPEVALEVDPPTVIRSLLVYHRLGMTFELPPEELDIEFCKAAHTFSPNPGVVNTLETICAAGLPMAIVSNSPFGYRALLWHLTHHRLDHFFSFLISSTDYGINKPHPLLMRLPADHLGIDPTDVWFVGDVPSVDVAGAQAVGMGSFLYNSRNFEVKEPTADVEFDNWDEFTELFRGMVT